MSTTPPRATSRWALNWRYVAATAGLFLVELIIALYVRDAWIRPFGGDVLVVILLYCFIRSFLRLPTLTVAVGVLAFSFLVEGLQAVRFVERVGLEDNPVARVVIGTSFHWADLVCYALGAALVVFIEWVLQKV